MAKNTRVVLNTDEHVEKEIRLLVLATGSATVSGMLRNIIRKAVSDLAEHPTLGAHARKLMDDYDARLFS